KVVIIGFFCEGMSSRKGIIDYSLHNLPILRARGVCLDWYTGNPALPSKRVVTYPILRARWGY
ncbi:MAG: hypothetical protein Q8N71_04240, partial [candidate division Zixibacteria bacterium]|nr:hypothetical protein [candidate division Zixibacteria bacterium]